MNNIPEYINIFIKTNNEKLKDIYNEGINGDNHGILYFVCSKKNNKMDVSFLNNIHINKLDNKDIIEKINEKINEKIIYVIKDDDENKIYILYI